MSARPLAQLVEGAFQDPQAFTIAPPQTCFECGEPAPPDTPRGIWRCAPHEEEERARQQRESEREFKRILEHHQGIIGVPASYRGCTFATLTHKPIVERGKAWLLEARSVSRGRFLALLGPTGVGKTSVAAAIVNEVVPAIRSDQRFMLAGALYRRLHDFDTVSAAMEDATRTRLLVIDDFQAPRPEVASMLEEIFIAREAEGRAMIVTSNLTKKQLLAVLGDRVVDRLKSWGAIDEFPGRSLRGEA